MNGIGKRGSSVTRMKREYFEMCRGEISRESKEMRICFVDSLHMCKEGMEALVQGNAQNPGSGH